MGWKLRWMEGRRGCWEEGKGRGIVGEGRVTQEGKKGKRNKAGETEKEQDLTIGNPGKNKIKHSGEIVTSGNNEDDVICLKI